jgi:hypothetical protein
MSWIARFRSYTPIDFCQSSLVAEYFKLSSPPEHPAIRIGLLTVVPFVAFVLFVPFGGVTLIGAIFPEFKKDSNVYL